MSSTFGRPVLFNGEMVKAILNNQKTETRRPIKGLAGREISHWHTISTGELSRPRGHDGEFVSGSVRSPFGRVGGLLYVRETFCPRANGMMRLEKIQTPFYRATDAKDPKPASWPWRPSIHMPTWAARIWLRVDSVRVERLQCIDTASAMREGVSKHPHKAIADFSAVWDSIYGKREGLDSAADPWVWVARFSVASTTGRAEVAR